MPMISLYATSSSTGRSAGAVTAPVERPVELSVAYNDVIGMELTYGG